MGCGGATACQWRTAQRLANCVLAITDDSGLLGCDSPKRDRVPLRFGIQLRQPDLLSRHKIMKADLVKAAGEVIPNPKILVNMVSRRVRQLCLGSRAMVEFVPGFGHADIALSEIAAGKL